jgi:delta 1-pyrroline-5-carboxylate dehydrogenase
VFLTATVASLVESCKQPCHLSASAHYTTDDTFCTICVQVAQELAVLTAAHVAAESQLQSLTLQLTSAQAETAAMRTDCDQLQQAHDSSVSSGAAANAMLQAQVAQLQAELVSLSVITQHTVLLSVCNAENLCRSSTCRHNISPAVRRRCF